MSISFVSSPARPAGDLLRRPFARVEREGEGRIAVQLSGALPGDWSLAVAQGCATRGFSLLDGYARRVEGDVWLAQLVVDVRSSSRPAPDFLAMVSGAEPAETPAEPGILDFEVSSSDRLGGILEVEVHAWEAVGLLAAVLRRVASVGLTPWEILLETEANCAFNNLSLKTAAGTRPTPRDERMLIKSLMGLLRGR